MSAARLHWVFEADREGRPPHLALLDLVRERPVAAPGVVLDVDGARPDGIWTCTEYETPGTRLTIPWTAEGLPPGEARLDFARDERLPELPVWTAIPRADGSGRTVVRTPAPRCPSPGSCCGCTPTAPARAAPGPRTSTTPCSSPKPRSPGSPRDCSARCSAVRPTPAPRPADPLRGDTLVLDAVDWADFRTAQPRVRGTAEEWVDRQARALKRVPGPPAPRRDGRRS